MTTTTSSLPVSTPDADRTDAFGERIVGVLNDACLALMMSVGHQTGLFDAMSRLPAVTSTDLARAAGLHERYVREWLAAMTTSRLVEYEPEGSLYVLPPEHAQWLTRAAGPQNLAATMQFIGLLAGVEAPLVQCFRDGGGVPYSQYTEFHRLMAEDSGAVFDATLLETVVPLVDGLAARLEAGIDVADFGCGSGHAINLLAAAYPNSRFVGFDFSDEAIKAARREARSLGADNARFEVQDIAQPAAEAQFDLVTAFDAIHDQARPAAALTHIAAALRDNGVFLMVDIRASSELEDNLDHPFGTFGYTVSTMHCMTVSLSLDGDGLGTFWGEQKARRMLAGAGFTSVEARHVEDDVFNTYFIARKVSS